MKQTALLLIALPLMAADPTPEQRIALLLNENAALKQEVARWQMLASSCQIQQQAQQQWSALDALKAGIQSQTGCQFDAEFKCVAEKQEKKR